MRPWGSHTTRNIVRAMVPLPISHLDGLRPPRVELRGSPSGAQEPPERELESASGVGLGDPRIQLTQACAGTNPESTEGHGWAA